MDELELKYGMNPHQAPARVYVTEGALPFTVLNGRPGAINLLDALNAWQLASELKAITGLAAAASFKHLSPAGAAVGLPLTAEQRVAYQVAPDAVLSPPACAYARARGADRLSSYGDFAALSDVCDEATASLLVPEVSDGVVAPGYTDGALALLRQKRKGGYTVLQIDPGYIPPQLERREVFGVVFEQRRNDAALDGRLFENLPTQNKTLTEAQKRDLLLAMAVLKYTQSNSVCYAKDGQAIGVGAGQQSRIHCTRLAGDKADRWHLRLHPKVLGLDFLPGTPRPARDNAIDDYLRGEAALLADGAWQRLFATRPQPLTEAEKAAHLREMTGVALASDAFFPFGDNIERAARSGVTCVAQPGGSIRDDDVIAACDAAGITMAFTGLRLFTH